MVDTKARKLLKWRETRIEDGVLIKKRKPLELDVERRILYFFKDDPRFHVPKIVDDKTTEDEIATAYISGMQVTRFFHLLDIINNYAIEIKQLTQGPHELKAIIINDMLSDLSYFQSLNRKLLDKLEKCHGQYPYLHKLEESFDAVVDCFSGFGYKPRMAELRLVGRDLEELAEYLAIEAKFVFRDATIDNVILNKPELDCVADGEAVRFILDKLAEPDGIKQFSGHLYHVDFGTANHLVTQTDDVVHILEHEMCSLRGIVPKEISAQVRKDELYYSTMAARLFRSWARRCVYLIERMKGSEDRYPNEHPEFYLNKVVYALEQLPPKDSRKRFEHLYTFCAQTLHKD